jgi:cytochrome c peroxidase
VSHGADGGVEFEADSEDVGTTTVPHADAAGDLPLFKVTCNRDAVPHPYLGRVIYTSDPGRALITGKCKDVGSIVMQQFRGLSARAPYFSNGSAATLDEVVDFYDRRFSMRLSAQDKTDLVNFLGVL